MNSLWYHSLSLIPDCSSVHKPLSWLWKHMWLHLSHSWLCLLAEWLWSMKKKTNVRNHHQISESVAFWLTFLIRCLWIFWATAKWSHLLWSRTQAHKALHVILSHLPAQDYRPLEPEEPTYSLVLRTNSLPNHFSTDVLISHILYLLNKSLSDGTSDYWRHHHLGPIKQDSEKKYPFCPGRSYTPQKHIWKRWQCGT